jgi:hypothetical protein
MNDTRWEQEEKDEDERDTVGRSKSVVALIVLALLVIGGVVLVERLREVSRLPDCLMTHATTTRCSLPSP